MADALADEHRIEAADILADQDVTIAYFAFDADGSAIGLTEAALRSDYVNGSDTPPVAFLEGVHVAPVARRNGVARGLVAAVESWAVGLGRSELASDALVANVDSHAVHDAVGSTKPNASCFFSRVSLSRPTTEGFHAVSAGFRLMRYSAPLEPCALHTIVRMAFSPPWPMVWHGSAGSNVMLIDGADWPLFGWTTDIRPMLTAARENRETIVLGTLVRSVGPTPRPVGTQMVFNGSAADGYFSGGCLESDVANHAVEVAETGAPRRLIYGDGSPWIDIRLLCGGALEILLERIGPDDTVVGDLLGLSGQREPVRWVSDGVRRQAQAHANVRPAAFDGKRYALSYTPSWRMLVIGGDPIALAIAGLASMSGFETTLVRPLGPTTSPPIAGVAYLRSSATDAIVGVRPDPWTAIVSATHDDDIDDEVVIAAATFSSAYIGVLGSVRRVPARRQRLKAAGVSDERVDATRAPIGVIRCGKGPWEVAVSVIAEIMQLRAEGSASGRGELRGNAGDQAAIERAA